MLYQLSYTGFLLGLGISRGARSRRRLYIARRRFANGFLPDTAPGWTGGSQSPGIAVLAGRFALFGAVLWRFRGRLTSG